MSKIFIFNIDECVDPRAIIQIKMCMIFGAELWSCHWPEIILLWTIQTTKWYTLTIYVCYKHCSMRKLHCETVNANILQFRVVSIEFKNSKDKIKKIKMNTFNVEYRCWCSWSKLTDYIYIDACVVCLKIEFHSLPN